MCVCAFWLQVHWFQQQHEKKRKKRDFGAASYAFTDYHQPFFSDFGPRPRQVAAFHRQRNRGVPLQNLFTDPLFKEQWYLVSTSNSVNRRRATEIRDGNRSCSTLLRVFLSFSSSFERIYRRCVSSQGNLYIYIFTSVGIVRRKVDENIVLYYLHQLKKKKIEFDNSIKARHDPKHSW